MLLQDYLCYQSLCIPLVKVGGKFVAIKAAVGSEELKDAKKALQVLGAELK